MSAKYIKWSYIIMVIYAGVIFVNMSVFADMTAPNQQINTISNKLQSDILTSDTNINPKTKNIQAEKMLKDSISLMRESKNEVDSFIHREASKKTKSYSWYISETVTNNNEIIVMHVDFYGEHSPASFAVKRVYQDEKHSNELREKGYDVYFYENGNVKLFQTRGKKETILQYFSSGKIKEFGIIEGDKTLVEIRTGEDGSIEYEKYEADDGGRTR
jgi:hypothetical protein